MPKDAIGNTLNVGDLLHVTLASPSVVARITKVQCGGTLIATNGGKQARMTPGVIMVVAEFPIVFDPPNGQVNGCMKLVEPDQRDQVMEGPASEKKVELN
jgi:hypothetical protein